MRPTKSKAFTAWPFKKMSVGTNEGLRQREWKGGEHKAYEDGRAQRMVTQGTYTHLLRGGHRWALGF